MKMLPVIGPRLIAGIFSVKLLTNSRSGVYIIGADNILSDKMQEVAKMVTKRIQLEFADPSVRAIDYIQDIRKAAESAGLNLYSRYDVQLQYPMPTADDKVVVEIKIPDEIADTFAVGNHLRGISNYLLSRCGDRYQRFLVGKRLLNYVEVSESDHEPTGLAMVDRLEAIVSFTKLLERSDDEALDQISRILVILKEAKQPWE